MSDPSKGVPEEDTRPLYARGRSRGLQPVAAQQKTTSPGAVVTTQLQTLELVTAGAAGAVRGGRSPGSGSPTESRYGGSNDGDSGSGNGKESTSSGNGNGNGSPPSGKRSPPGERGTPRGRRPRHDIVVTRPNGQVKKGTAGDTIELFANYFEAARRGGKDWKLYKYHLEYLPDIPFEKKGLRKGVLKSPEISALLGANIFDGVNLYVSKQLPDAAASFNVKDREGNDYVVKSQLVEELRRTDPMYMSFYNLMVKKTQELLGLTEMGRDFFDHKKSVTIDAYRLELWPGFRTAMREHDQNLMMCVEVTSKVLRMDSVLSSMKEIRERAHGGNWQKAVEDEIVGTVVMTSYNRKTYTVDGILWNETAEGTFPVKDKQVSYVDYYKMKYGMDIKSRSQPLLISKPKKKDQHRGITTPFKLVPELCQMTGLNDSMRSNFQLMKSLSEYLFMAPDRRLQTVTEFTKSVMRNEEAKKELFVWGIKFRDEPVKITGRIFPRETINFADAPERPDDKADWTMAFRNRRMLTTVNLQRWVVLVPERDNQNLDKLLQMMSSNARKMNFNISNPSQVVRMNRTDPNTYDAEVGKLLNRYGKDLQLVFAILPNNRKEAYSAVKRMTYLQYGIPSQCFVAKNMTNKGLMSIATKVVVQMNAKLGGEPWSVTIPLNNMMVCGFDVHKGSMTRGQTVGALVASLTKDCTKYFSAVSFHDSMEELSQNIATKMKGCLMAYHSENKRLPDRIFFYRDGVGEGELRYVYEQEIQLLKASIADVYRAAGLEAPKMTFIVVTKRINTRLFKIDRRIENPPPGTVVDDVITLPERYDFFIVAQSVRQGTVSPTSYNVLIDESALGPDKLQRLSYKLCHGYYNWSGTVAVPAPVQYAHKLAFLTGTALGEAAHADLARLLYYL